MELLDGSVRTAALVKPPAEGGSQGGSQQGRVVQELYWELRKFFRAAPSTDTLASCNICFLLVEAVAGRMDFLLFLLLLTSMKLELYTLIFLLLSACCSQTKEDDWH